MDSESTRPKTLKACTTCASAKVRCDMLPDQRRCKRCERLNKDCNVQPRGSHGRNNASRGYGREDLLRIESKFDSVAQLLSSSSPLPTTRSSGIDNSPAQTSASIPAAVANSPLMSLCTAPLSPEAKSTAWKMLELYLMEMMPLFPFVVLTWDETPEKLFQDSPVLYIAIMVVTCQRDTDVQQYLAQKWREEFGRRIWVQGEKSLQLLQGLLVYLAWHQTHLLLGSQLSNLMHAAMSLVTELGIDNEPFSSTKISPGALNEISPNPKCQVERTLEERRCYLGVFWINSVLRTCAMDMTPMPSRQSIDRSCHILEQTGQFQSDSYLARLVRMQQVADTIDVTLYRDLASDKVNISATLLMAITYLERELESLEVKQSLVIPQHAVLLMSHYMLQVFLYKIALDDRLYRASEFTTSNLISSSPYALRCSHLLSSCLSAIKALIDSFISLSNSTILSIPYPNWIQMGHSVLIFSRLLVTNHYFWDPSVFTGISDFTATLEKISCKIEAAMSEGMRASPPRLLPPMFNKFRTRLVDICKNVEESSRLGAELSDRARGETALNMVESGSVMMDEQTEALLFSFLVDESLM